MAGVLGSTDERHHGHTRRSCSAKGADIRQGNAADGNAWKGSFVRKSGEPIHTQDGRMIQFSMRGSNNPDS
jgi:hypothetical protein